MEILIIAVAGLLVIAAGNQLAPRVGVASPLLLLALGAGVGFLPFVSAIELDPDIVLEVVLPPLLFSTAVSMPVMDFRRELRAVAALAVGLVAVSATVTGLVVHAVMPTISLPWAIALGAVLSPTDAVAITVARGSGVSQRIITILEGEGLFNDATALILLSSATAAGIAHSADALQPAALVSGFLTSLALALAIGWAVGEGSIRVRSRITNPTADTVVSFTIPFLASLPTDHLGGSGLVAAVVAGLVISYRRPRLLPPAHRQTAQQNWRTIELILEGGVFLFMGLQAYGIVQDVVDGGFGLRAAVLLAAGTGAMAVLVRVAFVAPLLVWLRYVRRRHRQHLEEERQRLDRFEMRLEQARGIDDELLAKHGLSAEQWHQAVTGWRDRLERGQRRQRRRGADLDYFTADPLGPREGAVIVWAGMRGAVTLAAAQTLPLTTPDRPFLLLVALLVASGSLVIQGLTLGGVIRLVRPRLGSRTDFDAERGRLLRLLDDAATSRHADVLTPAEARELAIESIRVQRRALLDARDEGLFSSSSLEYALELLDAKEIMLTAAE
ncbi:sodium:proton antiporter [Actinomyces ruminicola]|uniref:cation:proton antiporter n=1 Tax=Actinomyces ruminicola TaxID=332524 RepID=UPI0011CBE6BE|nr:cation:proton antiporter [Actinomyces ruminicola]